MKILKYGDVVVTVCATVSLVGGSLLLEIGRRCIKQLANKVT